MNLATLSLFVATVAFAQAGIQPATQPLYLFSFQDGSRTNSGTIGGEAEENRIVAEGLSLQIVADENGLWQATFEPSPDGMRGPSLMLPDSEERLKMTETDGQVTITALVKWEGPDKHPDVKQPIVWKPLDDKGPAWALSISESGALRFDWSHADGSASHRLSQEKIPRGEWHHIAAVWKNDHTEGLQLYIDGAPGGINVPFTGGGPLRSSQEPIVVGSSPKGYGSLNGSLRELRIYGIALEPEEISALAERRN